VAVGGVAVPPASSRSAAGKLSSFNGGTAAAAAVVAAVATAAAAAAAVVGGGGESSVGVVSVCVVLGLRSEELVVSSLSTVEASLLKVWCCVHTWRGS